MHNISLSENVVFSNKEIKNVIINLLQRGITKFVITFESDDCKPADLVVLDSLGLYRQFEIYKTNENFLKTMDKSFGQRMNFIVGDSDKFRLEFHEGSDLIGHSSFNNTVYPKRLRKLNKRKFKNYD